MRGADLRLPAEWEPQAAVLLAWPHAGTDWAARLDEVESTYVALVAAIARFEPTIMCVPDAEVGAHAAARLADAGTPRTQLHFVELPYDDTWLRDSGPITLVPGARQEAEPAPAASGAATGAQESFALLDFRFTGWGGKFDATQDDALVVRLVEYGLFHPGVRHQREEWALEGGAIESDGCGTLLTTWRCLHQRHPGQTRAGITRKLCVALCADRVLWLDHGQLEGDDTDAHVDTLARFAPDAAIVYQACDDASDAHHGGLDAMHTELADMCTRQGDAYRLHALPWPQAIIEDGRRLAASYANYLVINGAVLVPAYGDAADDAAAAIIGAAHPGREVVQIPCRPLIWQNGSLHCVTMQLPAGVLA